MIIDLTISKVTVSKVQFYSHSSTTVNLKDIDGYLQRHENFFEKSPAL